MGSHNFVLQIVLGTFILDTYQYWVHRWMHVNRWLFSNFHSWHHRLYCPYAIGALYNHPIEVGQTARLKFMICTFS